METKNYIVIAKFQGYILVQVHVTYWIYTCRGMTESYYSDVFIVSNAAVDKHLDEIGYNNDVRRVYVNGITS